MTWWLKGGYEDMMEKGATAPSLLPSGGLMTSCLLTDGSEQESHAELTERGLPT